MLETFEYFIRFVKLARMFSFPMIFQLGRRDPLINEKFITLHKSDVGILKAHTMELWQTQKLN